MTAKAGTVLGECPLLCDGGRQTAAATQPAVSMPLDLVHCSWGLVKPAGTSVSPVLTHFDRTVVPGRPSLFIASR